MSNGEDIDYSLFLNDYTADARDGFLDLNAALLELERDHTRRDLVDRAFRIIHSLKSSSAMLEFRDVAELAHISEGLLDRMRKNEVPVNGDTVDLLFAVADDLSMMVRECAQMKKARQPLPTFKDKLESLKRRIDEVESREMLVMQGVVVINEDRVVESFNPAAERIFGYTADEVVGNNVNMLMPEPYRSNHDRYVKNYLETGAARIIGIGREVEGRRKDGTVFSMELAVNEMRLDNKRLFVGVLRDTTTRKRKAETATTLEKSHTVRVDKDLLDAIFNLVGEMIIARNRIDTLVADLERKDLKVVMAALDRTVTTLQEQVSLARLVPVDELFQKFPRMMRDLAREKNRELDFIIHGREIELDKSVLDAIGEPLMHLLRNAVDHGIEPADARHAAGKSRVGTVRLTAARTENHILISVEDDGSGIDTDKVKDIALHKGFIKPEDTGKMEERDIMNLLFLPGFSSAEKVTDTSGRGVGLDVVRTVAERLGGAVEVTSQKGGGGRFTMRLPLATAIMQTLMVGVGGHVYAVPSDIIVETLEVKPEDIRDIHDRRVLVLRQEVVPYVELGEVLGISANETQENHIAVVISRGERLMALGVDSVIDQMENIIKPFDPVARGFRGFSGGTIMGDGSVVLLLDIPALLDMKTV